jgi:riboflavin biosynthesis pyrimidine reductase
MSARPQVRSDPHSRDSDVRLELLYEDDSLARGHLPEGLSHRYGSDLGFERPRLYANFVSSIDGVVAIDPLPESSGSTISGNSPADRFVMGLLRASAEAILVAAGTLRATAHGLWTPGEAFSAASEGYAEHRDRLGLSSTPRLVVVTASGHVDPAHPAFERGALVVTTDSGARLLRGRLPAVSTTMALGDGPALDPRRIMDLIAHEGHQVVLTEGGPHLIGSLLEAHLLDELFLTFSPVIAGRGPGDQRLAFVEGIRLLPTTQVWPRLVSLRRYGSQLLMRYELPSASP